MKTYDWTCAGLLAIPAFVVICVLFALLAVACSPFALLWLLRRVVFADDVGLGEWLCDNLMMKLGNVK